MILLKLKFYPWLLNFYKHFGRSSGSSVLSIKNCDNLLSATIEAEVNEKLPHNNIWYPISAYFRYYPNYRMRPKKICALHSHFDLDYIMQEKISDTDILYNSLSCVFGMWLCFPECISGLKKYYPVMNIPFSELEFRFIDFWVEILPIFEDLLGHLLINDTPLLVSIETDERLYIPAPYFIIHPPIKEDIDFSAHLKDYYFGEGSDPVFKEVITEYLENRPSLKNECTIAWENDKVSNLKVPNELPIYFICNYLIKNISKYTLRFVVANTQLSAIRPIKQMQNEKTERTKALSKERRARNLSSYRKDLREELLKRASGINFDEKK